VCDAYVCALFTIILKRLMKVRLLNLLLEVLWLETTEKYIVWSFSKANIAYNNAHKKTM
jgi:hypothetical protein